MPGTYIKLPPDTGGGGSGFIASVSNTNSITLTVIGSNLTADGKLSPDAATAGSFKVTNTYHVNGLHSEATFATATLSGFLKTADWVTFNGKQDVFTVTGPLDFTANVLSISQADTTTDGYLSSADWNTFNNKEPAITAGTTADYYRGDKTFVQLNIAALTAETTGTPAATSKIGEILTAAQASSTGANVGSTGVYGNVISLAITAGRWQVWGSAGFVENGAVLTTGLQAGISSSASGAGLNEFDTALFPGLISGTSDLILTTPSMIIDIGSTVTYYLNTKFYYTSGSPQHRGKITALRIG